jgi:glutamine amidotransferase
MIAIVDYGSGNVAAIADILKRLRLPHTVTRDHGELRVAERYILPGVGAFDATMRTLRGSGLVDLLNDEVHGKGKRILGICVGMQILGDASDEGDLPGLGWIPGHIGRIEAAAIPERPKLPHMGWNAVRLKAPSSLFAGVDLNRGFYFLHSYHFNAADPTSVIATVQYGCDIACGVTRGAVSGLQFHPEKSHGNGLAVFRNFAAL